jgi:hypothetical protein
MFLLLMLLIFILKILLKLYILFIMKKLYGFMILLVFLGTGAFGDNDKQEEIDFLLFLPNSSDQFADTAQAMTDLDTVAHYLKGRNILPGQIYVYGYAANANNDIEPINLSINRALFVIQELQKRGIANDLFADPVGYGSVDLWGSNIDEEDRIPNRRVRILLEDIILTPALVTAEAVETVEPAVLMPAEKQAEKSRSFPWWLLLLPLIAIAAILLSKRKKNAPAKPIPVIAPKVEPPKPEPPKIEPQKVETAPVFTKKAEPPKDKIIVLSEDVIRRCAYGLYEKRYGQSEDAIGDWYWSISELTSQYEALGYRVIMYWEPEAREIR